MDKSDDYKKWVGEARPLNVSTHACTLNQPGLTLNPINAPYFLRWRTFQTPSMDFYPRETFPQSQMVSHTFKVVFLAGSQVFCFTQVTHAAVLSDLPYLVLLAGAQMTHMTRVTA